MRGSDEPPGSLFSYVDLEARIPGQHPLRTIREIVNETLASLDGEFSKLYEDTGRESVAPERLLRASLLQAFYSVRFERQLMEQLDYNLLFRWFVGLGVDKGYDTQEFVGNLRAMCVTPHVARKIKHSVLDGRTTRHETYAISQRKRKLVEEAFGWAKTIAGCAKVKVRGLARVRHCFTLAMVAYNLIRMPRLLEGAA